MFDKLIGNNHIKEILRRMLVRNRVPRSLLLAGAEGIGKQRFARELAKSFVCRNPQNREACDNCAACRRADIFNFPKPDDKKEDFEKVFFSEHIDLGMIIPCRGNILVNSIRELEREANFRPYEAGARFFIIDDADKMNDAASNALLKTLEEPSATSHIFLISSRPDSLLQTIRSRCQTIRFAPVEPREIENYQLSTKRTAPGDAALVARLSAGSIGRALNLDLGKFHLQREAMLRVLQGILAPETNHLALLKTAEEMNETKNKDDYSLSLEILQTLIHDIWTLRLGGEKDLVNIDIKTALEKLSAAAPAHRLSVWLGEIEVLRENLAVNLNRKIATDALFMKMASA
jgi:DNA polymerase-3 subunit delta'